MEDLAKWTDALGSSTADLPAHRIFQNLDVLASAIVRLRRENQELTTLRAQAIIHAKQLEMDYEHMRNTINYFRSLLSSVNIEERPSPPPKPPPPSDGLTRVNIPWHCEPSDKSVSPNNLTLRYTLKSSSIICSVRFNHDGSLFAFPNGKEVFVVQTSTGTLEMRFEIPRPAAESDEKYTRSLRFSPDGRLLVATCPREAICVFDLQKRELVANLEGTHTVASCLLFSKDSKRLFSAGFEGKLCIWDTETFRLIRIITHGNLSETQDPNSMIVALASPPDESFLAVGFMSGTVGIYSFDFDQPMSKFVAHQEYLFNVAISPFNSAIATASGDKTVKLWDLRGVANLMHTLQGHNDVVLAVCFSPHQPIVFTGSKDEKIVIWNQKTYSPLMTVTAHMNTMFDVCHHPTENCFVSCSGDGLVCVWSYSLTV